MKTTTLYDFTLTANGSQVILADANMYKVLTATGDIAVTRDGGATIKPLRAGRGEKNVPFQRLILRDLSGASNSGTILVGDSDFIDDTIVLSSAINVRPEPITGNWKDTAATTANTAVQVFAAASNTGGAIIYQAAYSEMTSSASPCAFLAKATAPANTTDGEVVLAGGNSFYSNGSNDWVANELKTPQFVAAGLGLFYISPNSGIVSRGYRNCRYKLL